MDLKNLENLVKNFDRKYFFDDNYEFAVGNPNEDSVLLQITDMRGSNRLSQYLLRFAIIIPSFFFIYLSVKIPVAWVRFLVLILNAAVTGFLWDRFVFRCIKRESVLVIRDVGLQLFKETIAGEIRDVKFFQKPQINQILINEGITIWRVVVFLVIELATSRKQPLAVGIQRSDSGFHNKRLGPLVLPFTYFRCPTWVTVQTASSIREFLGIDN